MEIDNKQEQIRIKQELKRAVQDFWDMNPCAGYDRDYTSRFEWLRKTEPYAYEILNGNAVNGKLVLEVGCGQGFMANHVARWAKHVTAIDISEESLNSAKLGSEELGVKNITYRWDDAENLSFPDNQFDLVYSLGVLHHTPNTQKAINEIHRVLKPGGNVVVMLYKKHNPKWLAVAFFRALSKLVDLIMHKEFYIANKLRESYIKKSYISHGTALLELFGCPVLKIYSRKQLNLMFSQFIDVEIRCYQPGFERLIDFLPKVLKSTFVKHILSKIDRITMNSFGFYAVITGTKAR